MRIWGVLAALLVALAGCGGDDEGGVQTLRSAPEPSGVLPRMPAANADSTSTPRLRTQTTSSRERAHARVKEKTKPGHAISPSTRRSDSARSAPADDAPARPRTDPPLPTKPRPRSPSGRAVYSRSGDGPFTTPTFTITAERWTVTYRNDGDFFQALILEGGKPRPFVLTSARRGSRTETLEGPGRFRLRITGADQWSLSVRDGTRG